MNYWSVLSDAEDIAAEMKRKFIGLIYNIDSLHAFLEAHPKWEYPMGLEVQWDDFGHILDVRVNVQKDLIGVI